MTGVDRAEPMTGIDSAYYRAYNRGGPVTGLVTWEDRARQGL